MGGSESFAATDEWSQRTRGRIREAERVLVICGEHTEESIGVEAELRIAREEEKPYLLLWGRRDLMCTKPAGAKPAGGMFSWTRQILQDQITFTSRKAAADAAAAAVRDAHPKR